MTSKKRQSEQFNEADIGAAFMAWYAESIALYPEGLVTQAQAARILGVSRMALNRLVARGYLRAVYFPKQPDIVGVSIGADDPTWIKLVGWLGIKLGLDETYNFPTACYVSFGDTVELWESGEAKKKCARDWNEIVASASNTGSVKSIKKSNARMRDILIEKRRQADAERQERKKLS